MIKKYNIILLIFLSVNISYADNFSEEKKFLRNFTEEAINIISDQNTNVDQKELLISDHVLKAFDTNKISQAVLGSKTWSSITKVQKKRFLELFKRYVSARYTKNLVQYISPNTKIRIDNAENSGKSNQFIKITSTVYDEKTEGLSAEINWYIVNDVELKLFNAQIEGAHMVIIFREQIQSILSKNSDFELFLNNLENLNTNL